MRTEPLAGVQARRPGRDRPAPGSDQQKPALVPALAFIRPVCRRGTAVHSEGAAGGQVARGSTLMEDGRSQGWGSVVNAVRTPLGLFALLALVVDASLVFVASSSERLSLWAPVCLLGFLILCVFAVVMVKPTALYHPSDWPQPSSTITVALVFPEEYLDIGLLAEHSLLEIRNEEGRVKLSREPNLTFGPGGWVVKLTGAVASLDSVRLELVDETGRRWRADPFAPFERTVQLRTATMTER